MAVSGSPAALPGRTVAPLGASLPLSMPPPRPGVFAQAATETMDLEMETTAEPNTPRLDAPSSSATPVTQPPAVLTDIRSDEEPLGIPDADADDLEIEEMPADMAPGVDVIAAPDAENAENAVPVVQHKGFLVRANWSAGGLARPADADYVSVEQFWPSGVVLQYGVQDDPARRWSIEALHHICRNAARHTLVTWSDGSAGWLSAQAFAPRPQSADPDLRSLLAFRHSQGFCAVIRHTATPRHPDARCHLCHGHPISTSEEEDCPDMD